MSVTDTLCLWETGLSVFSCLPISVMLIASNRHNSHNWHCLDVEIGLDRAVKNIAKVKNIANNIDKSQSYCQLMLWKPPLCWWHSWERLRARTELGMTGKFPLVCLERDTWPWYQVFYCSFYIVTTFTCYRTDSGLTHLLTFWPELYYSALDSIAVSVIVVILV